MEKSNILIMGAGAVGECIAKILMSDISNELWINKLIIADSDASKLTRANEIDRSRIADIEFGTAEINASYEKAVKKFLMMHSIDLVVDCLPPYVSDKVFNACYDADVKYVNLGTYSKPKVNPIFDSSIEDAYDIPMTSTNFSEHERWKEAGNLACICLGADPGMVNVFARLASDYIFNELKEVHILDGGDIEIPNQFGFNVWTVLDECMNPYVEYDKSNGGLIARCPLSSSVGKVTMPNGVVNNMTKIEHEEVVTIPRYIPTVEKATFSISLSDKLKNTLITLDELGLLSTKPREIDGQMIIPRNVVAAVTPQPTEDLDKISGEICIAAVCIGTDKNGNEISCCIYNTMSQDFAMKEYGTQAVALQTAFGAVAGIECICKGYWFGAGVFSPEYFEPKPYVAILRKYGIEFKCVRRRGKNNGKKTDT